ARHSGRNGRHRRIGGTGPARAFRRPRALHLAVLALGCAMTEQRAFGAPGRVREVTSLANPLVKDIKALQLEKFRDERQAFIAEGVKLVIDALDLGWSIQTLVLAKSALDGPLVQRTAARAVAAGGTVLEVPARVLTSITRRDNPQAVVG